MNDRQPTQMIWTEWCDCSRCLSSLLSCVEITIFSVAVCRHGYIHLHTDTPIHMSNVFAFAIVVVCVCVWLVHWPYVDNIETRISFVAHTAYGKYHTILYHCPSIECCVGFYASLCSTIVNYTPSTTTLLCIRKYENRFNELFVLYILHAHTTPYCLWFNWLLLHWNDAWEILMLYWYSESIVGSVMSLFLVFIY